jgi:UDP-N-acetylmuramyl pentapeptide synthase
MPTICYRPVIAGSTRSRQLPDPSTAVLAMGARGIGHIAELTGLVAPDSAVNLNVGRAHLGEFGSCGAIAKGSGRAGAARPIADGAGERAVALVDWAS